MALPSGNSRWIDRWEVGRHGGRAMQNPPATAPGAPTVPVFPIALTALGLMAFSQLLISAMSLAVRFEDSREVRVVEKEVTKIVPVEVPAKPRGVGADFRDEPLAEAPSVVSRPPVSPAEPEAPPVVAPSPIVTPRIDDPLAEKLVTEARAARVAGDMGMAIMKLEEAKKLAPEDPNVHYELGLVHEVMGVYDMAAKHYQSVMALGISGAGSLYELAAGKLANGFEEPSAVGKLSLGRVKIFPDPRYEDGQRVILTIPVQKAPAAKINPGDIAVHVTFFNQNARGEISQLEDGSWVTEQWATLPFDWAGGEESLRMTYIIPKRDAATEHLFGELKYHGQIVTLYNKDEVVDVQAWPPALAARIPQQPAAGPADAPFPEFLDSDVLPPGFDPNFPLLPPR